MTSGAAAATRAVPVATILAAVLLTGCSTTPFGAPTNIAVRAEKGYLSAADLDALVEAVPAPSADGSAEEVADRALSDRYRGLERSDRWLLATAHAELSPELARQHFDCALGVRFAATPTPRLTQVLTRLMADADAVAERAKSRAFRPRPVGVDLARPACQRLIGAQRSSASYPSGSAAVGTAYAEVMATLDPAHAQAAREIGHQIAISRLVCAMHYPADAAAGEAVGRQVFARAAATPAFAADIAAAQLELAEVRASGLTQAGCAAERAALAMSL